MKDLRAPAVWFPAVRAGTGADVFTETLVAQLQKRGLRAEITWLPLRAEYAPWTVPVPKPPEWANVVHVNTWLHPRFLPKRLPIIATIHHSVHHPALRPYKGFARAAYHHWWIVPNERRVLRRADRVVAVSQFVAEAARKALVDVPMEVIYNGVDTDRYHPGNRQHVSGEPFRLLYVGSWMARKGVDLLAPIMRELGNGFELRYTGGHPAGKDHIDMPANMHDVGRLHGIDAVVAAMQGADAFLFPSRSEGLPLSVLEAMASGLPVIAARGSSLVEVVEDGETGILCPTDDVIAFAVAARRLADASTESGCMSRLARERVVFRYALVEMVDAYMGVYSKLLHEAAVAS